MPSVTVKDRSQKFIAINQMILSPIFVACCNCTWRLLCVCVCLLFINLYFCHYHLSRIKMFNMKLVRKETYSTKGVENYVSARASCDLTFDLQPPKLIASSPWPVDVYAILQQNRIIHFQNILFSQVEKTDWGWKTRIPRTLNLHRLNHMIQRPFVSTQYWGLWQTDGQTDRQTAPPMDIMRSA